MKLVLIALLATGCVIGEDSGGDGDGNGDGDGDSTSGGTEITPVPTNGLVLDAALAAQLPTTALGTRGADQAVVLAPATQSAFAAPAGRALLKYAAICALPASDELVAGADRFPGYYGLAPEWATQSCGAECQRWVSACLLAHVNADGHSYPISLRGDRPSLVPTAAAAAAFTYQEAAFYGNVFQRQLYACWGADATHASANDAQRFLSGRVCGQIYGDCGLVATGPCAYDAETTVEIAACQQRAPEGGSYADCHTGDFAADVPRASPVIREVVTVYLQP